MGVYTTGIVLLVHGYSHKHRRPKECEDTWLPAAWRKREFKPPGVRSTVLFPEMIIPP